MTYDAECLRKYAELRDEAAFSEFVRRNINFVYSAAFRQTGGDTHLAEDIAQTVFVAAARKAAALGRHPFVGAWLHQATRYAAIDAIRSRRSRQLRESEAAQMTQTISEPDTRMEWSKVSPELDEIVASLGERDRDAVILRFFGGRSFAEIGAQLNLGESAARMRVERALEKLRIRLSRKGINSSCAALSAILAENGVIAAPARLSSVATASALKATAVGGLTASMGAFQIMTSAKTIVSVTTIAALAGIAVSIHEHDQVRIDERALAAAENTHKTDQAHIRQLADAVNASEQRRAALAQSLQQQQAADENARASVDEQGADAAARAAADTARKAKAKALSDGQAFLAAYGQAHDMLLSIGKAQVARNYAAFIQSGSLTPEQIDGLETQTAEHWMQTLALTPNGIQPTSPTLSDGQLKSILGDEGFQQLQNYQRIQPLQGLVNDVSSLSISEPLNPQQSAQLLTILANASSSYQGGGKATQLSVDWSQAVPQAQGILSAAQINALNAESQLAQVSSLGRQFLQSQSRAK
jgi:RNA polymerase sigma factor (sigma-70 family)